jgi:hypothetical protein
MVRGFPLGRLALISVLFAAIVSAASTPSGLRAQAISPLLYDGLSWRCTGPFDGGPVASVTGVAAEPGVYLITTPSGGAWKTIDGGDTWTSIDRPATAPAGPDPRRWTDPGNPRRIVRAEDRGIAVSLDGGASWMAQHHLPIAEVARLESHQSATLSIADPLRPGLIFKGTGDGVFVSFDNGAAWQSLQQNMPKVAINDLEIRGNNLVAATQGRSVWQLDDISPLRQLTPAVFSAAAFLFKPVDAVAAAGANLDYYLGSSGGDVTLEVLDGGGRIVHSATSAAADPTDRWLPVTRPLPAAAGHHRVAWNQRLDPPPALQHKFAHFAPELFAEIPAAPDGPFVLPGSYRIRLTAAGTTCTQPLVVRDDPGVGSSSAMLAARRQQFDLAMKMYDAMRVAHQEFVQLSRLRAQLKPLLTSADAEVAASAADLNARLTDLDGSDWTGLVIPDADDEAGEVDEKEGKHPDFVPPKPVSVSKDYDDPTSILGRLFANVDHPPALATVSSAFGGMLTRTIKAAGAPDAVAVADYDRSCQQLAGVLDAWRALNVQDLPALNAELVRRNLRPMPIATSVSTIACGSKAP